MTAPAPRSARAARLRRYAAALVAASIVWATAGVPLAGALLRAEEAGHALEFAKPVADPTGPANFTVNLTDAPSFVPRALGNVSFGEAVSVHLRNTGSYPHTFTLSKSGSFVLPRNWTPAELDAYFTTNGSLANVSTAPGASAWANFTLPNGSGSAAFEFVSLTPYQFQAGMFGFLNVSVSARAQFSLTIMTTDGLRFVPAQLQVNATSYPVVLQARVSNLGTSPHTWTLLPQANVSITTGNWSTYFRTHAPTANLSVPTTAGTVMIVNFTVAKPGIYEFFCEVPGHLASGMNGSLYVGVPLSIPVPPPNTTLVDSGVLIGAAVILGIGVFLAAVASLTGRFEQRPRTPGH